MAVKGIRINEKMFDNIEFLFNEALKKATLDCVDIITKNNIVVADIKPIQYGAQIFYIYNDLSHIFNIYTNKHSNIKFDYSTNKDIIVNRMISGLIEREYTNARGLVEIIEPVETKPELIPVVTPNEKKQILIFLDTETTGTEKEIHGIHQISGIVEVNGDIVDSFDFKFRPFETCEWSEEALIACHKTKEEILAYTDDEQTGILKFITVLNKYINKFDKTEKAFIVGYNIKFDFEMLITSFLRNNEKYFFSYFWSNPIDVMTIAGYSLMMFRHLMVDFKLITVAKQFKIQLEEEKLHDALYDIEITRNVYYASLLMIDCKNMAESLQESWSEMFKDDIVATPSSNIAKFAIDTAGIYVDPNDALKAVCVPESMQGTKERNQDLYDKVVDASIAIQECANKQLDSSLTDMFLSTNDDIKPIEIGGQNSNTKVMWKINDLSEVLTFGKHSGESFEQVLKYDPGYIIWLNDNHIKNAFVDTVIMSEALKRKDNENKNYKKENGHYLNKALSGPSEYTACSQSGFDGGFDYNDLPF